MLIMGWNLDQWWLDGHVSFIQECGLDRYLDMYLELTALFQRLGALVRMDCQMTN